MNLCDNEKGTADHSQPPNAISDTEISRVFASWNSIAKENSGGRPFDIRNSADDAPEAYQSGSRITVFIQKLTHYCRSLVQVNTFVEFQLLLLTFSTGVQDADSMPNFRCFASNQTGNTVILALGISGYNNSQLFNLHNVGVSLAMFVVGAIITGQLANWFGRRRRAWQIVANFFQGLMVLGAACIQFTRGKEEASLTDQSGAGPLAVIGLLAFSSGAQVATAREMQIQEITTAMATAAWVDLVIDPQLLSKRNRPRNRRALFLVALVSGSFVGAIVHMRLWSAWALLVSGSIKAAVTGMIALSRTQLEEKENTASV